MQILEHVMLLLLRQLQSQHQEESLHEILAIFRLVVLFIQEQDCHLLL